MGLLDPVYAGVNSVIAGAGAVAGGAVNSVGTGISTTGRGIGDSVTAVGTSWGDYAKDTGNYIMDSTKGSSSRVGTRSNPLGLERSQKAALTYGMNTAGSYQPTKRPTGPPTAGRPAVQGRKTSTGGGAGAKKPATPSTGVNKSVGGAAKKPATGGPKPQEKKSTTATAPKILPPGVSSSKTRISAASRPGAKAPAKK